MFIPSFLSYPIHSSLKLIMELKELPFLKPLEPSNSISFKAVVSSKSHSSVTSPLAADPVLPYAIILQNLQK